MTETRKSADRITNSVTAAAAAPAGAPFELSEQPEAALQDRLLASGYMARGVAHALSNLIGAIVGDLELLRREPNEEGTFAESARTLLSSARRAADLVRDLSAFSQRPWTPPRRVDVGALIETAGGMLARALGPGFSLSVGAAADLWPARGSAAEIESILVGNAVAAWIDGRGKRTEVRIFARNAAQDAGGAGDPAGRYERVIIEMHGAIPGARPALQCLTGGDATWHKEADGRSVLRLSLPRDAGVTTAQSSNAAPGATPLAPRTGAQKTILVVEDSAPVRRVVTIQLVTLGYTVIEAADGDQAIKMLRREAGKIDLLFSDVVLPGSLDGPTLAALAVAEQPGLRVILGSGIRGPAAGEKDPEWPWMLLAKPYRAADLASAIHTALYKAVS